MEMSKDEAARYHWHKTNVKGTLVVWTIYDRNSSHDKRYSARPIVHPNQNPNEKDGYLLADSLNQMRAMLPNGLTRLDWHPDDEPGAIESWF